MDKILASIIDKFKAANPRIFGIIAILLFIVKYAIEQGSAYGLFQITGDFKTIADWITWVVALLMGSRTYNVLNEPQPSEDNQNSELKRINANLTAQLDRCATRLIEADETIGALESEISALSEDAKPTSEPVVTVRKKRNIKS